MQLELIENNGELTAADETYLVDEAIEFIRKHYQDNGVTEVAFSGGKDSIVLYDLCKRAIPGHDWSVHYSNTTIEPPEVLRFVKQHYPEIRFIQAPPFFKMMREHGIPLRTRRWCCNTQKKDVAPNVNTFCGIRKFESCSREARGRIVKHTKEKSIFNPIFHWPTSLAWSYIKDNQIPYPSLYDEGFARIGCVVCPFVHGKKAFQHQERWPKHWAAFERAFKYVWCDKPRKDKDDMRYEFTDWQEAYFNWMLGNKLFIDEPNSNQFEFVFDGEIIEEN